MKSFDELVVRVELKYCERCGGLWLRGAMSGSIFCDPCKQAEALMPMKRAKLSRESIGDESGLGAKVLALGAAACADRRAGMTADRRMA